jgi:hypothetical protein
MLFAELDKGGWWVRCGMRDCGERLAWVQQRATSDRLAPRVAGAARAVRSAHRDWTLALPPEERHINLGPGWKQRIDGAYEMSEYAKRRIRQGKAPRYRRSHGRDYAGEGRIQANRQLQILPVSIVCWRCGCKQVMDAVRLHVSPGDPAARPWERKDWA